MLHSKSPIFQEGSNDCRRVERNDGTSAVSAVNASHGHDAGPGLSARSSTVALIDESSTWIGVLGQPEKSFGVNGKGLNDASGVGDETDRGHGGIGTTATGFAGVFGHTKGSGNAARGDHQGAGTGFFGSTVRGIAAVFAQTAAANGAADGDANCVLLPDLGDVTCPAMIAGADHEPRSFA
jgi:hypothetical protein